MRRRWYLIAIAVALGIWALWTSRHEGEDPVLAMDEVRTTSPAVRFNDGSGAPDEGTADPSRAEPALTPVIDEVIADKTTVCDGEEALFTIKAHTPGGKEDAYLHGMIADQIGMTIPLHMFSRDTSEGEPPPLTARVFGRDNVSTEVPLPNVQILPCKPKRRLHIAWRLLPNTIDEIELVAKIMNVTATEPMRPVRAEWDFGDGKIATSQGPVVEHDYSERRQDTLYSHYVVSCTVTDASGEQLTGRASLQLLNSAFEHEAYRHIVLLFAEMSPRFPEMGADGVVRQTVRVWHRHKTPVTLTRVVQRAHYQDSGARDPDGVEVRPFATTVIGHEPIEAQVTLSAKSNVFSYEYTLEGESADGMKAGGAFSIMRPPERPTRENSTPVTDALLKAKILKAREILHKEFVTDEDLYRLAAHGHFDDLKAGESSPSPPPRAPGR
jgi:hypothetical protein